MFVICLFLRDCVVSGIKPYTRRCQLVQESPEAPVEHFKDNAKLAMLLSTLRDILAEPTNKVIIWGQFTPELDTIHAALNGLWNQLAHDEHICEDAMPFHVRVDGRTTGRAQEFADQFNDDANCRVYLGQVSTGVGLTLNAANYMIYFSLPWKLGDYDQSKDRNYRMGQERDTVIYRLLGKGTIDENIAQALSIKGQVAHTITAALVCPRCALQHECKQNGTVIFEEGCLHKRSIARPVTKASPI